MKLLLLLNNKTKQIYNSYEINNKIEIKEILRKFTFANTRFILNIINTGEVNDYYNLKITPENKIYNMKDLKSETFEANFRIQNKVLEIIYNFSKETKYYLIYIPEKNIL